MTITNKKEESGMWAKQRLQEVNEFSAGFLAAKRGEKRLYPGGSILEYRRIAWLRGYDDGKAALIKP